MVAPERGQHFVSRFYLRNFIATDRLSSANKELWVADLVEDKILLRSPTSIAKRDYFYEHEESRSPLPRIETVLKAVEDRAAPLLKAVEQDIPPGEDVDVHPLFLFIALQVVRTPQGRRAMAAQIRRDPLTLSPEAAPYPRPRDPLLAIFWDIMRYIEKNPTTPDAPLLNSMVSAVRDLLPRLRRGQCLPFQAPDGYAYITCDQPASIFVPEDASAADISAGRGSVHVMFPQSPRNLLVICLDPENCTASNVHRGLLVDQTNDLVVLSADTQVYCSTRLLAERALQRAARLRASP